MKIILLDLNATLVENTHVHNLPYTYNVHLETYRSWLLDLLEPHYVILMTARPKRYKDQTLARLKELENWEPHHAYFSDGTMKAPDAKNKMLQDHVFPEFGKHWELGNSYIALESNSATAAMYKKHRIPTYTQQEIQANKSVLDVHAKRGII